MFNVIKRTLQTLISRSIQSAVNDEVARQVMQVKALNGEVFSDVPRWQQYGHTSVPPKGSEQLIVSVGGNRSNLAIICAEDKTVRLNGLKSGDSALYHQEGHFLKLTEDKTLIVEVAKVQITATESVEIDTPKTTISGDVAIGGDVSIAGFTTGEQGALFKGVSSESHDHDYTDDGATLVTKNPNAAESSS